MNKECIFVFYYIICILIFNIMIYFGYNFFEYIVGRVGIFYFEKVEMIVILIILIG